MARDYKPTRGLFTSDADYVVYECVKGSDKPTDLMAPTGFVDATEDCYARIQFRHAVEIGNMLLSAEADALGLYWRGKIDSEGCLAKARPFSTGPDFAKFRKARMAADKLVTEAIADLTGRFETLLDDDATGVRKMNDLENQDTMAAARLVLAERLFRDRSVAENVREYEAWNILDDMKAGPNPGWTPGKGFSVEIPGDWNNSWCPEDFEITASAMAAAISERSFRNNWQHGG